VSGRALTHAPGPRYWCEQALEPVRFRHAVQAMGQAGETDFIEVGPGNALLALGQQCVTEPHGWLASLGNKRREDFGEILTSVRELYLGGHAIDWDGFNRPYRRRRISLPTYPFERRRHWLDGDNRARVRDSSSGETSLAGERLRSALPQTQFEIVYSLARLEYLADHRIYAMPVLPFTVGLAALHDAARQHFGTDRIALANLQYREALVLPESGERFVQSILAPVSDATAELRLVSIGTDPGDRWRTHIVGMARQQEREDSGAALDSIRERCPCAVSTEAYYRTLRAMGLQYGPSFRAIEEIRAGDGEVLTRVRLPAHLSATDGLHPVLLDACLHIYPALVEDHGNFDQAPVDLQNTYLPVGIERFHSGGVAAAQVWAHAVRRREQHDPQAVTIDIVVYREDGSWTATLEGLSLKQLPPEALANAAGRASDCLYELQWTERPQLRPLLPDQAPSEPSGWLILADRGGVGTALAQLLSERGATCRLVTLEDVIERDGECSWSPDDLVDPFAALVRALMQGSRPLVGILNLWPLDVATHSTVAELHEAHKVSAGSALALFRASAAVEAHPASPARVWLVSRQAAAALPHDLPVPASGAIWGLGRSAALEHPQSWGGLIDLDAAGNSAPACEAAALLRELLSRDGEDQIALRAERRFAARLVRVSVAGASKSTFDPEGWYLITGGLGALGVEVAKWLASRHGIRHLLLVSRRGERDPSAGPVRDALAGLGAEVAIREADVTREADVRALLGWIRQAGYTLKGVVHCAGGLDDGIMLQMDWGRFERVAAPKVVGGWLLHELTREFALDHFVVFSSVLSLIGSAGQSNYAAANGFLDALVARRHAEGLPALALNWGPWDESGLATISGERGRGIWRARGTRYISAELGRQVLDRVIGSGIVHAAITLTQWPVFLRQFEKTPLLYSVLREEAGAVEETNTVLGAGKLKDQLKGASAGERHALLIDFIRQQTMSTLGISDSIDARRPLRELGLDSLMSVTLVNRLEAALGIRISPVRLIAGPSIDEIVGWILADLDPGTQEEDAATVTASSTGAAAGWLVSAGRRAMPRLRLFCFPFAGGGSAVYRSWSQSLHPSMEVVAVEPPGRLGRIKEQPIADIDEFVTQLVAELLGVLDRPFAFFGHCLGGLTMYETARRLIHSGAARPVHLFASGARPPDRILDLGPFEERLTQDLLKLAAFRIQLPPYAQPDDVFAELIRHFNIQATEQLLETPELRELMLPVVRAEFQMAFNYDFGEEPPWDIPITCFAALDDPYVSRSHALGWGRFTNSRLQVHMRPGSHFAVVDDVAFIHAVIDRELGGVS
jgi:surfactin synthase thioesterase subunit/acyl carrier protein/nucleoside-diphosphate-sugar epimerase